MYYKRFLKKELQKETFPKYELSKKESYLEFFPTFFLHLIPAYDITHLYGYIFSNSNILTLRFSWVNISKFPPLGIVHIIGSSVLAI